MKKIRSRRQFGTAEQYIKGKRVPEGLCRKKNCRMNECVLTDYGVQVAEDQFKAGDPHLHVPGGTGFIPDGWYVISDMYGRRSISSPEDFEEEYEVMP